jgi:HEAT repeat protein
MLRPYSPSYAPAQALLHLGETSSKPLLAQVKSAKAKAGKKAGALLVLALLREEKAFEMMLKAIADYESPVGEIAIARIHLYEDDRAVEPLVKCVKNPKSPETAKASAAETLGELGDARAVDALVELLMSDGLTKVIDLGEDTETDAEEYVGHCYAAAEALGRIGDKRAVEPLTATLLDDDCDIRAAAAQALGAFKEKRAVDALIAALEDTDQYVAHAAAASLARIDDRRAIPSIIKAYRRPSSDTHYFLYALKDFHAAETVDFFLSVLDKDSYEAETAALALGETGDKRAIEPLKRSLKSKDTELRMAAAAALLHFGDEKSAKILQEALKKDDMQAVEAASALAQSPHPKALPWLVEAMERNPHIRGYCARAIGKIGDKKAVEALLNVLKDEGSYTREQAVAALAVLKDRRVLPNLIDLMVNDPDDDVRSKAHDALHEITGQNFGWNWQRWKRWYEKNKNE